MLQQASARLLVVTMVRAMDRDSEWVSGLTTLYLWDPEILYKSDIVMARE